MTFLVVGLWLLEVSLRVDSTVIVTSVKPNRGSLAGGTRLHIQVSQGVHYAGRCCQER